MDVSKTDATVALLYQAAAQQAPWEAAMAQVAERLQLLLAQLVGVDLQAGRVLFSFEGGTGSAEATLDYTRTYHRLDPNAQLAIAQPVGTYVATTELLGADIAETHPFYRDYLVPYGGRWVHGAKVYERDGMVVLLGLHRGVHATPIAGDDLPLARQIVFHTVRAFEMAMALRHTFSQAAIGQALLDRLNTPVLLMDAARCVVVSNAAAQQLLSTSATVRVDGNGLLRCQSRAADTELGLAVKAMQLSGHGGLQTEPPIERKVLRMPVEGQARPLVATLIALRPETSMGAFGPQALAMLVLHDANRTARLDSFVLAAAFDLTPAEAKVASQLVAGLMPAEIAQLNGTKLSTTKTHVRAIQDKLDVRRTPELVAVLSALQFAWPAPGALD